MQRNDIHQVQKIDRIDHKIQQLTEVLQQQHMNVDVPTEIQCQNTATHQNFVKDAQMQRQVQMIQKTPSKMHRSSRTC